MRVCVCVLLVLPNRAHLETLVLSSVSSSSELSELFFVSGLLSVDTLLVSGFMTGVQ